MFVGVARVQRWPCIQRVGLHQVHRRGRTRQARAPDVDTVLVATGDQVQALQRLDACRLEFVALDLRVKRHEQPYIVPGGGQPAR